MCIYIYTYIYIYIYIYIYTYIYTRTHTHIYTYIHIHTHIYIYIYAHTFSIRTAHARFNVQKRVINKSEVIWCSSLQVQVSIWVSCSMPKSTQKNSQIELDQPCQSVRQKLVVRVTRGEGHVCPSGMTISTTATFYG